MNKTQKIAMIRQYLSGADLSESRCYILEVGEALPPDYRRNFDRVIWVTDDRGDVKKPTGKNDILIQVTSKETVKQVLKLGDYLDNRIVDSTIEPQPTQPAPMPPIEQPEPIPQPEPIEQPAPPPAIIQPLQYRRPQYRKSHF